MGMYDVPANIKKIKDQTSKDKIFYIGYSQGTIQMFYGLFKNGTDISGSLHKIVQLAPCAIAGNETIPVDYENTLFKLWDLDVYAFYNYPGWPTNLAKICS